MADIRALQKALARLEAEKPRPSRAKVPAATIFGSQSANSLPYGLLLAYSFPNGELSNLS